MALLTNCVVIHLYSYSFPGSCVLLSSLAETGDLASSNHRSKVSMHDLNTSIWQMVRDLAGIWLQDRSSNAGEAKGLEWGMTWLVFKITFPLKTFTSSVSLLLSTCYWKIASCKRGGKPFDAGSVCISHTLTRTYTKKYISSSISETAKALAGICDPNPYFNFPPLMQTNSILVAFPHKRSAIWEMSFFACCI